MERNHLIGAVLAVIVLGIVVAGAFYTGVGPAPGGASESEPITDFPTATPHDASSGDGSSAGATPESTTSPFSFTVERIEECGRTCRDVTVTLVNNHNEAATGITVFTRLFAGQNNTDTDDRVWEAKEDVGTLEAGESYTMSKRVELSLQEGLTIERNDGWITILTTVQSDETTVTFKDSEQVV